VVRTGSCHTMRQPSTSTHRSSPHGWSVANTTTNPSTSVVLDARSVPRHARPGMTDDSHVVVVVPLSSEVVVSVDDQRTNQRTNPRKAIDQAIGKRSPTDPQPATGRHQTQVDHRGSVVSWDPLITAGGVIAADREAHPDTPDDGHRRLPALPVFRPARCHITPLRSKNSP
jgi:hypothetical protein